MYYFTSDLHLNHKNILNLGRECFSSIEEMNSTIIENYNSRIQKNDQLYILGDVSFGSTVKALELLRQIRCDNIHLIIGNHDRRAILGNTNGRAFFKSYQDYLELKINDGDQQQLICLFHYPVLSWNKKHRGSWALHGHCHGTLRSNDLADAKIIDVGVDTIHPLYDKAYLPYSYDDIRQIMATKSGQSHLDHHVI